MEREWVIKALNDCIDRPKCIDCPNLTLCAGNGFEYLLVKALELIKELTEEVADLKAIAEQYQKQFEEAKSDTVRMMHYKLERLFGDDMQRHYSNYNIHRYIGFAVKEMLEENI